MIARAERGAAAGLKTRQLEQKPRLCRKTGPANSRPHVCRDSHEIWDVTDPAQPARLALVTSWLADTHKSW
jgi:hypothetical protein